MDTEAFLLKRQELVNRLHSRRSAALPFRRSAGFGGIFGMSGMDWVRMLLGGPSQRRIWGWGGLALSAIAPLLAAFVKRKIFSVLFKRNHLLERISGLLKIAGLGPAKSL